jgi:hypothetical protein
MTFESFGVVLWEMFSFAEKPYGDLSNAEVIQYVLQGSILSQPQKCPDEIYELMKQCWKMDPNDRPDFSQVKSCSFNSFLSNSLLTKDWIEIVRHHQTTWN